MKLKIYAVKDKGADTYGNPIFLRATGEAIRNFTDAINNKDDKTNVMANHPEHFDLYSLGEYDTDTAAMSELVVNLIIRGIDTVTKN